MHSKFATMLETIHINDRVTIGGQPTAVEPHTLAGKGFKSIVNSRCDGEAEQPLSPTAEWGEWTGPSLNE